MIGFLRNNMKIASVLFLTIILVILSVSCGNQNPTPIFVPTLTPIPITPIAIDKGKILETPPPGLVYQEVQGITDASSAIKDKRINFVDSNGKIISRTYKGYNPKISPSAKLVAYQYDGDLFILEINTGDTINITNTPDCNEESPTWSPDGESIAFIGCAHKDQFDVKVFYLDSGKFENITNTSEFQETCMSKSCELSWWSEQPDYIFVGAYRPKEPVLGAPLRPHCHSAPNHCDVFLAKINIDGSAFQIVDQVSGIYTSPDLSPNGKIIAYDGGNLLNLETLEHEILLPSEYGLNADIPVHSDGPEMIEPSWSPNGDQIVWTAHLDYWGNIGIVKFDLVEHSAEILYAFRPYYGLYSLGASQRWMEIKTTWSPNGEWISFNNMEWPEQDDDIFFKEFVWIISVDGQKMANFEGHMGSKMAWSSESAWFAFTKNDFENKILKVQIVNIEEWELYNLDVSTETKVVGWIE
jgi:Tol biopolymer transport system component